MNDEPLLLCPFCKLDAHVWSEEFADLTSGHETTRYYVKCNICGGRTGYERSLTLAIQAWNTRDAKRKE